MRWIDIFQAILLFFAKHSWGKPPSTWFNSLKPFDSGTNGRINLNAVKAKTSKSADGNNNALAFSIFGGFSKDESIDDQLFPDLQPTTDKKKFASGPARIRSAIAKYSGLSAVCGFVSNLRGTKPKKKVLILMCDTGGGHRASAQALDTALGQIYPGKMEVNIMDIWSEHGKWPFNTFVSSYRFLAKNPLLWRIAYAYGYFPPTRLFTEVLSRVVCYNSFKSAIIDANPDMVVSVHPLCQHIPIPIVKELNANRTIHKNYIPFLTVVTDLGGAHPTWFHHGIDRCYVASEKVKNLALRHGIQEERIALYGLPIRPSFWKPTLPKDKLRTELGLQTNKKTVLLMGGGDGVGGLSNIAVQVAKTLGTSPNSTQMVVVCGHNERIVKSLSSRNWPSNVNVVIKGFCSNIDEFMSASDCLVTKAGPGTIAESMIRGVPLVISSYLPGQEAGNVPYVVDGGFGVYTGNRPNKVANAVRRFFDDEQLLLKMSVLARRQSHQDATTAIAEDMGQVALGKRPLISTPKEI